MNQENQEIIDNYKIIQLLGAGLEGKTYLVKKNENKYAMKAINLIEYKSKNPYAEEYINNEISILKSLDHINIIKLVEAIKINNMVYIITEYYNGKTLNDYLKEETFSEKLVQILMKQIIKGIKYLHNKNIFHRDIKLENILLHFENEEDLNNLSKKIVKIIDFGFAKELKKENKVKSPVGSILTMAPIRIANILGINNNRYGISTDLYSIGIICWEMIIGKKPYNGVNNNDIYNILSNGKFYISQKISKEALSFIIKLIQFDDNNRLDLNEIEKHDFINKETFTYFRLDNLMGIQINNKNNKIRYIALSEPMDIDDKYENIEENGDINMDENNEEQEAQNNKINEDKKSEDLYWNNIIIIKKKKYRGLFKMESENKEFNINDYIKINKLSELREQKENILIDDINVKKKNFIKFNNTNCICLKCCYLRFIEKKNKYSPMIRIFLSLDQLYEHKKHYCRPCNLYKTIINAKFDNTWSIIQLRKNGMHYFIQNSDINI